MKVEKAINYVLYPNIYKTSPKSGKIPLYVRIIAGEKAEWTSGIEISKSEVLKWNKATSRIDEKNNSTNNSINDFESELQQRLLTIQEKFPKLKAKEIKKLIADEKKRHSYKIIGYVEEYFTKNVQNKDEHAKGTKKNYQKAINHLKAFLTTNKLNTIGLQSLDYGFASDFKNYLTDSINGRKGMCENSASGIIKKFRKIFNEAIKHKHLSSNPFTDIKIKEQAKPKIKLNSTQIRAFYCAKNLSYSQQVYTDIFLFSVCTGLAYSDAQQLNMKSLTSNGTGRILVDSARIKTEKQFSFFLPKLAIEIIEKYKNTVETNRGNLIPNRTNKELNLQLKVLADKAGLGFSISSHHGRHSFRSLCGEADLYDNTTIKKMMGLSLGKDMDRVYDHVTEARLWKAKEKIDLYLEKITQNGGE